MLKINKILSKKIKSPLSLRGLFPFCHSRFPFCHSRESGNPSPSVIARKRSNRNNLNLSGFSLIELMVAVVILVLAIFGIFHAYSTGFMGMADARDRTVASNYMREIMEDIKNTDFEKIEEKAGTGTVTISGKTFTKVVTVEPSTNLKKVSTIIYWDNYTKSVQSNMLVHFMQTTAGDPSRIMLFANPYKLTPGSTSTLTAIIKDKKGNNVNNWSGDITFFITFGGGSLANPTTIETSNGQASINYTAPESEGDVTIEASATDLTSDSVAIIVTTGAVKIALSIPSNDNVLSPGQNTTITAKLVDPDNILVSGASADITFSVSGPGNLASPTTKPTSLGTVDIDLSTSSTPGTITVTASSPNLDPGTINIITGGNIDLTSSSNSIPKGESENIAIAIKDLNGIPIKYYGNIELTSSSNEGVTGTFSANPITFNGSLSSTFSYSVDSLSPTGTLTITAIDSENILNSDSISFNITQALIPDHITVTADPQNLKADGISISNITATVKTEDNRTVENYSYDINFGISDSELGNISPTSVAPSNGIAETVLSSDYNTGVATINVTSIDENNAGNPISGSTIVGFYSGANRIDLIAKPQSILTGGGSEGTCTIIATIKEGIIKVSGYEGTVTFTIEEGHPNGVVFTNTNKSSIIVPVIKGVSTIDLISKNWVGTAKIKATASDGISDDIWEYLNIPVVANKDLEIFLLYKNDLNKLLNYYYPNNGLYKGNWDPGSVYGKFCVDNINNLYILDGDCIKKKNSRGDLIGTSAEIASGNYAINIGPDGYIYFSQNLGTEEAPAYCVKKINPNTLVVEDVMNLTPNTKYYGFNVDSDLYEDNACIYIHNHTNQTIEKRSFETSGIVALHGLTYNYNLSALAIAGGYIGGVGEVVGERKAFIIPKDFSSNESEFTLTNIPEPLYISSIGGDFLFSGLNNNNEVVFGRYSIDGSLEWNQSITKITEDLPYSDCIIGAYPF